MLASIKQRPKYNPRSSAELLLTPLPAKTKKTLSDRAFQVQIVASTLWNGSTDSAERTVRQRHLALYIFWTGKEKIITERKRVN